MPRGVFIIRALKGTFEGALGLKECGRFKYRGLDGWNRDRPLNILRVPSRGNYEGCCGGYSAVRTTVTTVVSRAVL